MVKCACCSKPIWEHGSSQARSQRLACARAEVQGQKTAIIAVATEPQSNMYVQAMA